MRRMMSKKSEDNKKTIQKDKLFLMYLFDLKIEMLARIT